jgi:hypothetical protein
MKKTVAIAALLFIGSVGTAVAGTYATVTASAPATTVNVRSTAKISIVPSSGFRLNMEYPTKLVMVAPSGVTMEKATQVRAEAVKFEEASAEFVVAFTASSVGKKTLTGELKYAVCKAADCIPQTAKVAINVDVK